MQTEKDVERETKKKGVHIKEKDQDPEPTSEMWTWAIDLTSFH